MKIWSLLTLSQVLWLIERWKICSEQTVIKHETKKNMLRFATMRILQNDFRKRNWYMICVHTAYSLSLTKIW